MGTTHYTLHSTQHTMLSLLVRRLPSYAGIKQILMNNKSSFPLLSPAPLSTSPTGGEKLDVDFYFDTVSPYTWPAWEVLLRYQKRWNLDIHYKPVFLGGLVTAAGNPYLNSMAECPNKASYQFMDLETRTAKFFNIPFKMKADPFHLIGVVGSLQQQRFITAVLQKHPHLMEKVLRSFWLRSWSEDKDVHTEDDITTVARSAEMNEKDIADCLAAMKCQHVKATLKMVTEEAVDRGAFGSPTMFCYQQQGENEAMFWGSDRFEMIAYFYGKQWLGPNPA